jgi:putative flavoprotein involved in K+ transport
VRDSAEVIVIGAGPAGLSVAAALERAGSSVLVLERGPCAGDSWRRMPTHMPLNSPWGASAIDGARLRWRRWSQVPSRAEYHAHLMEFARVAGLRIQTGCVVEKVARRPDGGFRVATRSGDFEARRLINATGYFCQPYVPRMPGAARSQIHQLTVPEYRDAESLRERLPAGRRRVLIVGARITAGQLAQELHDAGFEVTISHRSPLRFGWAPLLQRAGYRLY